MRIECPSGLTGEARKIRGEEMAQLAERAKAQGLGADTLSSVVRACWEHTIDTGPYPCSTEGKVEWSRVNLSDIHYLMIQLRIASLPDGHEFTFPVQCSQCGERYGWSIDLTEDLPLKPLPESSRDVLRTGGRFNVDAASRHIEFELPRVAHIAPLRKHMKQLQRRAVTHVETVAAQLVSVEGLKKQDLWHIHKFVRGLDWSEILRLRDLFDDADGGYELDGIQTKCEECRWTEDVVFPFGATFYRPQRGKKRTAGDEGETASLSSSAASFPV